MKIKNKQVYLFLLTTFIMMSCTPEKDASEFNNVSVNNSISGDDLNDIVEPNIEEESKDSINESSSAEEVACETLENTDICVSYKSCQPMYNEGQLFISCIPKESAHENEDEQGHSDNECSGLNCSEVSAMPAEVEDSIEQEESQDQEQEDTKEEDKIVTCLAIGCEIGDVRPLPDSLDPIDESASQSNSDGESEGEKDTSIAEVECGEGKIVICHIPPGNQDAATTMCLPLQAWNAAHKEKHGRNGSDDYEGACWTETLNSKK